MTTSKTTYTSIPEFIDLAVQFEKVSANFYSVLQQRVTNQEARDVLGMLAEEEIQHQHTLEDYDVT